VEVLATFWLNTSLAASLRGLRKTRCFPHVVTILVPLAFAVIIFRRDLSLRYAYVPVPPCPHQVRPPRAF